jgi:replication factor A1
MKAKDVRANSKVDLLEVTITEMGETRNVNTKLGGSSRVCDAKGKDAEGGVVALSLWNDEIDRVKVGAHVKIVNGWAREFRGEVQVSAGRMGKLEVS